MMGQQESVNESMDGNYTWTLFFWQGKQNIVQKGGGKSSRRQIGNEQRKSDPKDHMF